MFDDVDPPFDSEIFSEVSHCGIICVCYELIKCPKFTEIEPKEYALSDLCGIINALCALEDNGLKNDHPLSVQLPSTNLIKFYRQYSHNI